MDFIVPISSVLIFFLNGYILFRRWLSKRVASDMSYIELVALVDPLITAIVCPMTSDLLYTPEWLSGCSSPYTIIITSVIVVLSLCSLVVCRRLIELALPCSSSGSMLPCRIPPWVPSSVAPLTFVFVSSTGLNFTLTCLLLPVVSKYFLSQEIFDDEMCQPFFLTEMMLNVLATSAALQITYTGLYFCICKANLSEEEINGNVKTNYRLERDIRIVFLHTLTILLCLISACLLRFIFMTCSCKGLFELTRSLPTVIVLMTLKLPCTALIQLRPWRQQEEN